MRKTVHHWQESYGKPLSSNRTLEDVEKESWLTKWNQPQDNDWAYVAVDGDKVVMLLGFADNLTR